MNFKEMVSKLDEAVDRFSHLRKKIDENRKSLHEQIELTQELFNQKNSSKLCFGVNDLPLCLSFPTPIGNPVPLLSGYPFFTGMTSLVF